MLGSVKTRTKSIMFAMLALCACVAVSCTTITSPVLKPDGTPALGPDGKVLTQTIRSTDSAAVSAFGNLGLQAANLALQNARHSGK